VTTDQGLSMLVHGPSKAGKSSFSFTGPFPLCVLDAEGSTKFITTNGFAGLTGQDQKIRKIYWDPNTQSPPRHDGTWDVAVVQVLDWMTMRNAKERLQMEAHDFQSLSLDSITEIQRKCKANLGKPATMQQQDWGVLLHEMDLLIRGFRDLLLLDNSLRVVTFIAETEDQRSKGKWRPNMQGAIATSMPYWVDICGYAAQSIDESGARGMNLLVANDPNYEAGERVQGRLPDVIRNPRIVDILHAVYS
jgi:hypothetical protein